MKKILQILFILSGGIVAVLLIRLFIIIYSLVGTALVMSDNKTVTLYKVLAEIGYQQVGIVFLMVFAYMLLLDLIVLFVVHYWRKLRAGKNRVKKKHKLSYFWFKYRSIHIFFILISIFVTLSITAPAMVMNSFTAIVSISVLVSNLTKKIGKD